MENKYINARNLRNNATLEERRIWNLIKNKQINGLKFRRQFPIGNYIVDFVCLKIKLIIEIDGGQHNETKQVEYDKNRTKFFESNGYKVIRFWNSDIYSNIEGVISELKRTIDEITG